MTFYASSPIGLGDGVHEASNGTCFAATSHDSFEIDLGSMSNDDTENVGPLSPLSNASGNRISSPSKSGPARKQSHRKQLILLADGIQTLKKAKEELERENEKLRNEAKVEQAERQKQISALEDKIIVLERSPKLDVPVNAQSDEEHADTVDVRNDIIPTESHDLKTPVDDEETSSPQHEDVTTSNKSSNAIEIKEETDLATQSDISCGSKSVDSILMKQNENLMEQAALIQQITECEAGLKTSWSMLQEQLDEKDKIIADMTSEKAEIMATLEAQKLAESKATYKLVESEDEKEKLIQKNKELEVVVADKNFLVAELGKELEVSHRMQDTWRKKIEEQKQRLTEQHEREIASLCKNRMIEVEKRVTSEVEKSMKAKHVAEISTLLKETRDLKDQMKDLQLQLSDESFQKGEALRQLKELSYKYKDLEKEKENAEEARRKELEPMVIAMRHDVEMELKVKYDAKVNALESMLEEQVNKVRDLKLKQFDSPDEVLALRRELAKTNEKLTLLSANEDTVTVHSGNCITELTASLDEIKKSVFFSDRRLEEMTMPAINDAKAKVRESISKMDEALRIFCIVDEISRDNDRRGRSIRGRTVSISSVQVPKQKKSGSSPTGKDDDDISLNSLAHEWKEYHDAKRREEDAKKTLMQKEAAHLVRQLREKTFLLDCVDL